MKAGDGDVPSTNLRRLRTVAWVRAVLHFLSLTRNERDGTCDNVAADARLMKMLVGMADSPFVRVSMRVQRVEMSIALLDATEFP